MIFLPFFPALYAEFWGPPRCACCILNVYRTAISCFSLIGHYYVSLYSCFISHIS